MIVKPPFPLRANGTLTFAQFSIKVFLVLPNELSSVNDPGINNTAVRYEGNVVDSGGIDKRRLPPEIIVDTHCWLKLDSGLEGTLVLEQIYSVNWKSLEQVIGQKFTGLLLPKKQTKPSDWT